MSSLIDGKWNHAVTSSMDRTIKVWDMGTIVEDVFPLSRHDNPVLSIMANEQIGVAISMTRYNSPCFIGITINLDLK